jgi:hypothetical protein
MIRCSRGPCGLRSFAVVAGVSPANGMSDIEGKVAREAMSERSRGDASDIDGQNREVEVGGSTRVNVGKKRVSKGCSHGSLRRPRLAM